MGCPGDAGLKVGTALFVEADMASPGLLARRNGEAQGNVIQELMSARNVADNSDDGVLLVGAHRQTQKVADCIAPRLTQSGR